jgi:ribosomal protein S27E
MKAASTISYILAGLLVIFSFLFILGSGGGTGNSAWLTYGIIGLVISGILIFAGFKFAALANPPKQEVIQKIDLSGNVRMDTIKCQSCGAPLAPEDVKLVNGAVMVTCHSCGTTYQVTEEPKW